MASGGSDKNMSEEIFNYPCTSCAEEHIIKEGLKYCIECKGYCCKDCLTAHKKYPTLREHNLLDISTALQTNQTTKLPAFPTERCSIHPGKIVDMYCGDHDVVGCYVCITIGHKQCTDIHSIPDDVATITKDGELNKTREELQTNIKTLQLLLNDSNEVYAKHIDDDKEEALQAITDHRREIDAVLDRLDEKARGEVQSTYNELKSRLMKANEKIESILNQLIELEEQLRRAEGNVSQTFVSCKLAESTVAKEDYEIKNIKKELETIENDGLFLFVANDSFVKLLQQENNIGCVKIGRSNTLYRVKKSEEIAVKIPSDKKTCNITGCCITIDNELIITDGTNNKLKRISMRKMSVIDYIDLPYDLRGVCCVNNTEVAVACYDDQMIQFVSVGQTLTPTRQLKVNHKCHQVANMDNKLYISDYDSGKSVYVHDMDGILLQTISKDSNGYELFKGYSEQIALSDCGNHIFVGSYRSGLVHLDKAGNHVATVKDPDIEVTEGVCIDGRGSVFFTGRSSNKVVQYRYDGTKVGVIAKEENGIKSPISLCFHRGQHKLIVTMYNSDSIRVFGLE